MEPTQRQRRLAAILCADVQGYSRLMGSDDEGTLRALTACREVFSNHIKANQGRVVNTAGDAILAEFHSVVDAVVSAMAIQRDLEVRNAKLPDAQRMVFRIGINLGDVLVQGDDIFGDGVNIAARLQALADGGGICISGSAYDQVEPRGGLAFLDMGDQTVKNIARPVRAFKLVLDGSTPPPKPAPAAAKAPPAPQQRKLAVLPFENLSGDAEQASFCAGLAEDLVTDLSGLPRLSVVPQATLASLGATSVTMPAVARQLGVRYVVEGSVRRLGSRVRLTAKLSDMVSGKSMWGQRFDREFGDIFELQDDLVRTIGTALEVQMVEGDQALVWRRSTRVPEAYDCFQRARSTYLNAINRQGFHAAIHLLEQALRADPDFSSAYAYLAELLMIGQVDESPEEYERALTRAQANARKALDLDPGNPLAYNALAMYWIFTRQHEQAREAVQQAIARAPTAGDVRLHLAIVQLFEGHPKEAVATANEAVTMVPQPPPHYGLIMGIAALLMGNFEETIGLLKIFAQVATDSPWPHIYLAGAHSALGHPDEAAREVAEVLRLAPKFNLDTWSQRRMVFQDKADELRIVSLLRNAGLP